MSKTTTSGKTAKPLEPLRPMTEEQVWAAAMSDPDGRPLTPDDLKRMKRIPRAKIIRRALGLTQEEFAARFCIPLGTLRDWEQGAAEPDQAARAYLKVIAFDAEAVSKALKAAP
jgi:putative transcriptional regulator